LPRLRLLRLGHQLQKSPVDQAWQRARVGVSMYAMRTEIVLATKVGYPHGKRPHFSTLRNLWENGNQGPNEATRDWKTYDGAPEATRLQIVRPSERIRIKAKFGRPHEHTHWKKALQMQCLLLCRHQLTQCLQAYQKFPQRSRWCVYAQNWLSCFKF
jgi:hypothetical protein